MRTDSLRLGVSLCVLLGFGFLTGSARANPSGGTIRSGTISISGGAGTLTVNQLSNRGIIEWNSFSIANGETTRFNQPSSTAATLNRVTGASMSTIDGNLFANGRVFLLNPNGILIGMTGVVDVGGFTASTLDVSDAEFLAGGDLNFVGPSQASVVNLGSISAMDGDVFLVAASVVNSGRIDAPNGTAGLAAGNDVLIKGSGHERVFVRGASGSVKANGVLNDGTVEANIAELKAHGGNIYGMAVRNEGRVAATGVSHEGGQIFLRAGGGKIRSTGKLVAKRPTESSGGTIEIDAGSGVDSKVELGDTVDASDDMGKGGTILIIGESIDVLDGTLIFSDGDVAGGSIRIGGNRQGIDMSIPFASDVTIGSGAVLDAGALTIGDGGEVVVYSSKDLSFQGMAFARGGSVSGNGGFVELTGKENLTITGLMQTVDVSSPMGADGMLLIDPASLLIQAGGVPEVGMVPVLSTNTLFADDLSQFLDGVGSLALETDFLPGSTGTPNITMYTGAEIVWSSDNDLSIHAARDLRVEYGTRIESTGIGSIDFLGDRAVRLGGNFSGGPTLPTPTAPSVSILTGGEITIGNADEPDTEGVDIKWADIGSSQASVSIAGFNSSSDPLLPAALNVEISQIKGYTDVGLVGNDATSLGTIGVQVVNSTVTADTGMLSVAGTSVEGTGAALGDTAIEANGGAITLSGKTASAVPYNSGLLLYQNGSSYPGTFVSNGNSGTISLYGESMVPGGNAIAFYENGGGPSFEFIGGDGTQNVDVFGYGGEVELTRVSANSLDFSQSPMTPGDFSLTNSQIGSFSANAANDVTVENLGNLQIGDIDSTGAVSISLASGNLNVAGEIRALTSIGFSGDGMDQIFHIGVPVLSPLVDFSGSPSGLKVETEGTLNLNGYSFSNVLEVRGTGPGNNFLIAPDGDTVITLSTLTETGMGPVPVQTIQAEIGGVSFVSYDDISGGFGNDTFHVMLDVGYEFSGNLSGEEGNDRFILYEGGSLAHLDGGAGYNTLDFSPFTASSVFVDIGASNATQVDSFDDIDLFVGGGSGSDLFRGTVLDDRFDITSFGEGTLIYDMGGSPSSVGFSGFQILDGKRGADRFVVGTGAGMETILGGDDVDVLDFSGMYNPVEVDFTLRSATNVDNFAGIEEFEGGQSSLDRIMGTPGNDRVDVLSDTAGMLTVFPSLMSAGLPEEFSFSGFESIGGAAGDDLFVVANGSSSPFSFRLGGDAGNDTFQMLPGGGVAIVDGGGDFDTIDYSAFTTPVVADFRTGSATQIGTVANMEKIVGGQSQDTLIGTNNSDVFRIQTENGGMLNAGVFEGFEFLRGAEGNDQFLFSNQATVAGVFGGGGVDSLQIDDRDLGGTNTYVIGDHSVSRNPTYNFDGLESLTLRLGPGNDTVVTSGNGLIQILNGGGGNNFLDMGAGNFITSNPIMIGGSKIYVSGFDGPYPPPEDTDTILTQQAGNQPQPGGPSNGATYDQFSSGGVLGTFAGGNAFAASVAASAILQQSLVLQADGTSSLLQAPTSLDGTFTLPPEGVIKYLEENLDPDVWSELADAIDFEGAYLLIMADGPKIIDLSEATPADIAATLTSNLLAEGAGELLGALELAVVIPVTSLDGPVAIVTIPVPVGQNLVALLTQLLADDAFAELTQALENE